MLSIFEFDLFIQRGPESNFAQNIEKPKTFGYCQKFAKNISLACYFWIISRLALEKNLIFLA